MAKRKLNPKRNEPVHPTDCACRGSGFLYPGGDSRRNDRPAIMRCAGPGVQTSAPVAQLPPPKAEAPKLSSFDKPITPPPVQPDLFDRARRAAGEREDD